MTWTKRDEEGTLLSTKRALDLGCVRRLPSRPCRRTMNHEGLRCTGELRILFHCAGVLQERSRKESQNTRLIIISLARCYSHIDYYNIADSISYINCSKLEDTILFLQMTHDTKKDTWDCKLFNLILYMCIYFVLHVVDLLTHLMWRFMPCVKTNIALY